MKRCSKCGVEKNLTEFRLRSNRPGPRPRCRACEAEDGREYRTAHPDKRAATRLRYSEANREKEAAHTREWRKKNPEQVRAYNKAYREQNPEFVRELQRSWQVRNPERVRMHVSLRRARLAGASSGEIIDRFAIYDRDGGRCHICGLCVPREVFTLDHLVPLVAGGMHGPANVRVAHRVCNSRRGPGRLPAQLLLVG